MTETNNNNAVNLLWTGGWDSTFRLLYLVLVKKIAVQPYYVILPDRVNLPYEMKARDKIKAQLFERFPSSKDLLRPIICKETRDIKEDKVISDSFREIRKGRYLIGTQYEWLALLAKQQNIHDFEMTEHHDTCRGGLYALLNPMMEAGNLNDEVTYQIGTQYNDSPVYKVFKYFRFPLWKTRKKDMADLAKQYGFLDILHLTWFCHYPQANGVPCGGCVPCIDVMEQGMGYRIPIKGRLRYYLDPKVRYKKFTLFMRRYPGAYRALKSLKQIGSDPNKTMKYRFKKLKRIMTCEIGLLWIPEEENDDITPILPDGWFDKKSCNVLYSMAKKIDGPILEIGGFVGRSTTCIALGIRDSYDKDFDSIDLHFDTADEMREYYKPIHGSDYQIPDKSLYYIENGGTLYHQKENLGKNDLLKYVNLFKGNFKDVLTKNKKYNLIFCDASHDVKEIKLNMDHINELLLPKGFLVCDDVCDPDRVTLITRLVNIKSFRRIGRLYVGRKK